MGFIDKLMALFGYVKAVRITQLNRLTRRRSSPSRRPGRHWPEEAKEAATEAAVDIVTGLLKERLNKRRKSSQGYKAIFFRFHISFG